MFSKMPLIAFLLMYIAWLSTVKTINWKWVLLSKLHFWAKIQGNIHHIIIFPQGPWDKAFWSRSWLFSMTDERYFLSLKVFNHRMLCLSPVWRRLRGSLNAESSSFSPRTCNYLWLKERKFYEDLLPEPIKAFDYTM